MRFTVLFSLFLFSTVMLSAQKRTKSLKIKPKTLSHQAIFNKKIRLPKNKTLTADVVALGKSFLSTAYPKSRIDTKVQANGSVKLQPIEQEVLVVNLKTFDCVTFVENMIALAQTHREAKPSFDSYKKHLTAIRYRNSAIDYAARLHYFSDWLFENDKQGIVKIITKDLGGEIYDKPIFFMSLKKDTFYGNMADPNTFATMRQVEEAITKREKWYIPKDKVADIENQLKEGDIIGITNRLAGMDMAHVGIVVRQNGQAKLLHASSQYHRVVITEGSISEYLGRNKGQTGIMVARLVD